MRPCRSPLADYRRRDVRPAGVKPWGGRSHPGTPPGFCSLPDFSETCRLFAGKSPALRSPRGVCCPHWPQPAEFAVEDFVPTSRSFADE
ncbi:hypothetical protein AV530_016935 [Patagioenas fasciata monilis]|uniref:Uncharacterized protein n=1 Tax=Patagioenas fasciata monilis TaxID=372326 RepID=A0A1V4J4S7_PATFA|nr:hypothetical protein AV530_016935 [Patagioenas fasciata monilis]